MKYALSLILETDQGEKLTSETWECTTKSSLEEEYEKQKKFIMGRLRAWIAISKREDNSNIPNYYAKVVGDLLKIFGDEEISAWYFEYCRIPENNEERVQLFEEKYCV